MKKTLLTLITTVSLAVSPLVSAIPVHAFELTKETFDYVRYADTYPDLKAAFGYDRDALYNHYNNNGRQEGRKAFPLQNTLLSAEGFDYKGYADAYPDVKAAFGYDRQLLFQHYMNYGRAEGRKALFTASEAVENRACILVSKITTPEMSDVEKIRAVHDWLCINTSYNTSAGKDIKTVRDCTATGPIIHGKAVCTGYADAFDLCMGMLGIDCRYVIGYANGGLHAWNEVYVDRQWLAIDVTFDDPVPDRGNKVAFHKYFLLSQDEMAKTHRAVKRMHAREWDDKGRIRL